MKKKIGIVTVIIVVLLICGAVGFQYKSKFGMTKQESQKTEDTVASMEEETADLTKESKTETGLEKEPEDNNKEEEQNQKAAEENSQENDQEEVSVLEDVQEEIPSQEEDWEGMEDLKNQLSTMVAGYEGDWAVYVYDLKKRVYMDLNSHSVKAASLIKLYIMGAVLEKTEKGELTDNTGLDQLLTDMITVSDNESANELVVRLSSSGNMEEGMKEVNAYARRCGYGDTSQGRTLQDVRTTPAAGENFTSARDCAMFMKSIYDRTCISPEVSDKMLELLKGQTRKWKIPAGVPEGTVTANKTGELSDTENDVAIVYSPGTDYVLAVTSTEVPDANTAQGNIVNISSAVYQYFNP